MVPQVRAKPRMECREYNSIDIRLFRPGRRLLPILGIMQLRQIESHPAGRQTNPLFVVKVHAWVISVQKSGICTLGASVLRELLCFLEAEGALFGSGGNGEWQGRR